jgi:hypothetical protein
MQIKMTPVASLPFFTHSGLCYDGVKTDKPVGARAMRSHRWMLHTVAGSSRTLTGTVVGCELFGKNLLNQTGKRSDRNLEMPRACTHSRPATDGADHSWTVETKHRFGIEFE